MSTEDSPEQKALRKLLLEELKKPGNSRCSECLAKQPRWCSTNLGVFMCIRCSGIHRCIGTHITKVRSVTLDKWTQEMYEFMRDMGNEKAAEIWEANMPPGVRPREEDSAYTVENFIRDKYERKKYFRKSKPKKAKKVEEEEEEEEEKQNTAPVKEKKKKVKSPKPVETPAPAPAALAAPQASVKAKSPPPQAAAPDLLNFDTPAAAAASNDIFPDFFSESSKPKPAVVPPHPNPAYGAPSHAVTSPAHTQGLVPVDPHRSHSADDIFSLFTKSSTTNVPHASPPAFGQASSTGYHQPYNQMGMGMSNQGMMGLNQGMGMMNLGGNNSGNAFGMLPMNGLNTVQGMQGMGGLMPPMGNMGMGMFPGTTYGSPMGMQMGFGSPSGHGGQTTSRPDPLAGLMGTPSKPQGSASSADPFSAFTSASSSRPNQAAPSKKDAFSGIDPFAALGNGTSTAKPQAAAAAKPSADPFAFF